MVDIGYIFHMAIVMLSLFFPFRFILLKKHNRVGVWTRSNDHNCSLTLSTHTLSLHNLSLHTLSLHTLSTHSLSTQSLSTHSLSTHSLYTHSLYTISLY